jgi:hypothetical protein
LRADGWPILELGTQVTMLPQEHWEEFYAARKEGRGEEYLDAKAKEVIPMLVREGHVLGSPSGPDTTVTDDRKRGRKRTRMKERQSAQKGKRLRRTQADNDIYFKVSPRAAPYLSRSESEQLVAKAWDEAVAHPGWKPGYSYQFKFTKGGMRFLVVVNNTLHHGCSALIGMPEEFVKEGVA